MPEITDEKLAMHNPELAVLSAMAHGQDPDTEKSVKIALAAQMASTGLDADRAKLYLDLILNSLPEAACTALQAMNPAKYEYQSKFARQYYGQGKAEGQAELVLEVLTSRYGMLAPDVQELIRAADTARLKAILEHALQADTLAEALNTK